MTARDDASAIPSEEAFALTTSRHFPEWLASIKHSLAFTTYRAGKVFFLGVKPDGKLSVFERSFSRCMGMGVSADTRSLLISSEYQVHRLDNILPQGVLSADGTDATFAPHQSWVPGDLDIHDIGFGQNGKPVFINTLFNCIAAVSDGYSFKPLWKPPFISRYAAEDRCHLNGMALEQGEPHYGDSSLCRRGTENSPPVMALSQRTTACAVLSAEWQQLCCLKKRVEMQPMHLHPSSLASCISAFWALRHQPGPHWGDRANFLIDQPPMVLIELLPTACAVTLLPVLRTAELATVPENEALYPAVVAVAETDPELVW
jgi:hypothetical protein